MMRLSGPVSRSLYHYFSIRHRKTITIIISEYGMAWNHCEMWIFIMILDGQSRSKCVHGEGALVPYAAFVTIRARVRAGHSDLAMVIEEKMHTHNPMKMSVLSNKI